MEAVATPTKQPLQSKEVNSWLRKGGLKDGMELPVTAWIWFLRIRAWSCCIVGSCFRGLWRIGTKAGRVFQIRVFWTEFLLTSVAFFIFFSVVLRRAVFLRCNVSDVIEERAN